MFVRAVLREAGLWLPVWSLDLHFGKWHKKRKTEVFVHLPDVVQGSRHTFGWQWENDLGNYCLPIKEPKFSTNTLHLENIILNLILLQTVIFVQIIRLGRSFTFWDCREAHFWSQVCLTLSKPNQTFRQFSPVTMLPHNMSTLTLTHIKRG